LLGLGDQRWAPRLRNTFGGNSFYSFLFLCDCESYSYFNLIHLRLRAAALLPLGLLEIDSEGLRELLGAEQSVQLVDVRELDELTGPLGCIAQAKHIPLGELKSRVEELETDAPIVVVCRSGARSARGYGILKAAGLKQVANLTGGMNQWRAT
jgi:rhodanese-related sulfurtransferase